MPSTSPVHPEPGWTEKNGARQPAPGHTYTHSPNPHHQPHSLESAHPHSPTHKHTHTLSPPPPSHTHTHTHSHTLTHTHTHTRREIRNGSEVTPQTPSSPIIGIERHGAYANGHCSRKSHSVFELSSEKLAWSGKISVDLREIKTNAGRDSVFNFGFAILGIF